jgi:hypothetical protein
MMQLTLTWLQFGLLRVAHTRRRLRANHNGPLAPRIPLVTGPDGQPVEERGIKMPSFFGYMLWSGGILLPLFALLTILPLP